jgi:hypothetical protein
MSGSLITSMMAGVILLGVAFAHPAGPSIFLLAVTPFDAIPFMLFGAIGNSITLVPILVLIVRLNPARWGEVFLGTRIQQVAFALVLVLLGAHAAGILTHGIGEILNWLRFVTLFLLMGVFAWNLRRPEHILLLARVAVISWALLSVTSALDFYLGIQVLPVTVGDIPGGALERELYENETWRFTGAGLPVNRYANNLLAPTVLGVGWFMSSKSQLDRLLAVCCTATLVFAELLTVSRSGLAGMVLGAIILLPMALGIGLRQLVGLLVIGGIFGVTIFFGLEFLSAGDSLGKRFDRDTLDAGMGGRLVRWGAAVKIWAANPIFGVGWGLFTFHSQHYIARGGWEPTMAISGSSPRAGSWRSCPCVICSISRSRGT